MFLTNALAVILIKSKLGQRGRVQQERALAQV